MARQHVIPKSVAVVYFLVIWNVAKTDGKNGILLHGVVLIDLPAQLVHSDIINK